MLHTVYLPEFTETQLSEIVAIQLYLLEYAASTDVLNEQSCSNYLCGIPELAQRGAAIAQWIWKSKARYQPLIKFSTGTRSSRQEFHLRVRDDIKCFEQGAGVIETLGVPEDQRESALEWEIGAWDFLGNFYADLNRGFPKELFLSGKAFTTQDFLREFVLANEHLTICPACDETDYKTHRKKGILAEKDHFLPKSYYPHLSCHPLNLVPICHYCNHPKGNKDILQAPDGSRRDLADICLPYRSQREEGLAANAYLPIDYPSDPRLAELKPLQSQVGKSCNQRLEAFRQVYEISDRWAVRERTHEIGSNLFQRIQDVLRTMPAGFTSPQALIDVLDWLLYDHFRNVSKNPHHYAKVWWLAALVDQALDSGDASELAILMPQVERWSDLFKNECLCDAEFDAAVGRSEEDLKFTPTQRQIQKGRNLRQSAR